MLELARIFLEVDSLDSNFLAGIQEQKAVMAEWLGVLANLITFGEIGIKIVFPIKVTNLVDLAIQS